MDIKPKRSCGKRHIGRSALYVLSNTILTGQKMILFMVNWHIGRLAQEKLPLVNFLYHDIIRKFD
jgi:hypothetical protein